MNNNRYNTLMTLNEFIDDELQTLSIQSTEKNLKKIRAKCLRLVKEDSELNKIWKNAKTIPIAKTRAKFLPARFLNKLHNKLSEYLIKIAAEEAKISFKKLNDSPQKAKTYEELNELYLNLNRKELRQITDYELKKANEETKKYEELHNLESNINKEIHSIMLEAIFEKMFSKFNKNMFYNDLHILKTAPEDSKEWKLAALRMNKKQGYYYHE